MKRFLLLVVLLQFCNYAFSQFYTGNIYGEKEKINDLAEYNGNLYFSVYYDNYIDFFSVIYEIDTSGHILDSLEIQGILSSGLFKTNDSLYVYGVSSNGVKIINISNFNSPENVWEHNLNANSVFDFAEVTDSFVYIYGYYYTSSYNSFVFRISLFDFSDTSLFVNNVYFQKGKFINGNLFIPIDTAYEVPLVYKYDMDLNLRGRYEMPFGENHVYLDYLNERFYGLLVYTEGFNTKVSVLLKMNELFGLLDSDIVTPVDTQSFPGIFNSVQVFDNKVFCVNSINTYYDNFFENAYDNYIDFRVYDTTLSLLCTKHLSRPGVYTTVQNIKVFDDNIYVLATEYNYDSENPDLSYVVWKLDKDCNLMWSREICRSPGIVVYPVPFRERLNLKLEGLNEPCKFEIYDISGRKLSESDAGAGINSYDFSYLPKGVYIYRLVTKNGKELKNGKIIKE